MELSQLESYSGEWLRGNGPEADVVISSRVRVARNLAGELFPMRAGPDDRVKLRDRVLEALRQVRGESAASDQTLFMEDQTQRDRNILAERNLVSREFASPGGAGEKVSPDASDALRGRAVVFSKGEEFALMVNEEDHLRLQQIRSGFDLQAAFAAADTLDTKLANTLSFAYHDRFGFLTACPTNCGTGLRASVMVHLPALAARKTEIEKFLQAVAKMNLTVRGIYGEGTRPAGHFYQVSNQQTLGRPEAEQLEILSRLVRKVVEYERRTRTDLMEKEPTGVEDRIWRAYGILRSARIISSEETTDHLSDLRLGLHLGFLELEPGVVNDLFVLSQPAHLQALAKRDLEAEERDHFRAEYIRDRLVGR